MKISHLYLLITLVSFSYLTGCYYDNEEDLYGTPEPPALCDTLQVSFATDIVPILNNAGCIGCHNGAGASGNVNLEDYSNTLIPTQNGDLLSSIEHDGNASKMPQGGQKLLESQIQLFRCWIEQGALDN